MALAIPAPFTSFGNWIHNGANFINKVGNDINTDANKAINTVGTAVNKGLRDVSSTTYRVTNDVANAIDSGINKVDYYGHKGIEAVAKGVQTGVQDTTKAIKTAANDVASEFAPKPGHITAVGKIVRAGDNFVHQAGNKIDGVTNHVLNTVGTALDNGLNDADTGITKAATSVGKVIPFTAPVTKYVVKGAGDVERIGYKGIEGAAVGIQKGVYDTTGAFNRGADYIANEIAPTTTTTAKPSASSSS